MAVIVGEKFQAVTDIGNMFLVFGATCVGIFISFLAYRSMGESRRIFLSYTFADKDFAKKLAKDLSMPRCQILDPLELVLVGENIKEKVTNLIEDSDGVIVVISKNMLNSKWVNEELSQALQKNKTVLPIKVDDSEVPDTIRNLKYIETKNNYGEALAMLRRSIRSGVRK